MRIGCRLAAAGDVITQGGDGCGRTDQGAQQRVGYVRRAQCARMDGLCNLQGHLGLSQLHNTSCPPCCVLFHYVGMYTSHVIVPDHLVVW